MAIKSDAQRRAVAMFNNERYEQIQLRVHKGMKEEIVLHAQQFDKGSVNSFLNRAITETMERDKASMEGSHEEE